MKKTLLTNDHEISQQPSQEFCDSYIGCYVEEYFHEMLTFERKRSERSGRPFLVMTLDFSDIIKPRIRRESVKEAMKGLSLHTRETDIKGWYRTSSVLGVIFTEMNSLETETLEKKISKNLRTSLSEELIEMIQISFYHFPDDGKPNKPGSPSHFTFYTVMGEHPVIT